MLFRNANNLDFLESSLEIIEENLSVAGYETS
jgi:hypothetical protein